MNKQQLTCRVRKRKKRYYLNSRLQILFAVKKTIIRGSNEHFYHYLVCQPLSEHQSSSVGRLITLSPSVREHVITTETVR